MQCECGREMTVRQYQKRPYQVCGGCTRVYAPHHRVLDREAAGSHPEQLTLALDPIERRRRALRRLKAKPGPHC